MDTEAPSVKTPKSVALTAIELKALKSYRKRYSTSVECAISLGIDRLVLNRIILVGSGSEKYINKIRETIAA